jgi:Ca2+-binding EF-hand superfamily protein
MERRNAFQREVFLPDEGLKLDSSKKADIYWKRPNDYLDGYTGTLPQRSDPYVLDMPMRRIVIRGYTGFIPNSYQVIGAPAIPSEEKQIKRERRRKHYMDGNTVQFEESSGSLANYLDSNRHSNGFRSFGKGMDLPERYEAAVTELLRRGQTQEMLLKIVQAKFSERVKSYAEQHIRVRKLFEAFDNHGTGALSETRFRECLESCNVQFDDIQILALFAYFDPDYTG